MNLSRGGWMTCYTGSLTWWSAVRLRKSKGWIWVLRSASPGNGSWGAREGSLEEFPEAILAGNRDRAKVRMPRRPGPYRLFAYVRDGAGNGAVHNVPLRVVE